MIANNDVSSCLFLIILVLSFSMCLVDITEEKDTNKALPISILIINSIIIALVLLSVFKVAVAKDILNKSPKLLFFLVLILSLILAITDTADHQKTNRTLPLIILIINSFVTLVILYGMISMYMKKY